MTILPPIIARWRATLRARPDSEHEMTLNRLAFAIIVIIWLALATAAGQAHASEIFYTTYPVFIGYIIGALGLFAHILYWPRAMPARRIAAAIYDMIMISYAAQACGTPSGFFYPLYLWTIFGNGFRFGVFYLFVSMSIAIVGFTMVLIFTGFWVEHPGFSTALLIGLVMLPVYVSRLIRKLSEAKRQAEDASKAKGQFLASVTHELRTPLNAIIGLSSLFEGSALDREHAEMIETIGSAGRTLLGHINSILDLSRMEAGKMLSQDAEFDLYDLLVQVRNIVAVQAKELKVSIHITSRTPRLIVGARQKLEQVLLNLAGNAVKFTPSGCVVIAVDAIAKTSGQMRLKFEVSDTGIGISPAAQNRIFESFSQADDTIIDRFGGTGLGLALCKQLVEIQGGQIGVESSPGAGSTFWFEINVAYRPDQLASSVHSETIILICADDRLKALVGSVAPNVHLVEDAGQAIAKLNDFKNLAGHEPVVIFDCCSGNGVADAVQNLDLNFVPTLIRRIESDGRGLTALPGRSYYATTIREGADLAELMSVLQIALAVGGRRLIQKPTLSRTQNDKRLSILIADDNRTNQLVFSKILERAGHTVTAVENGAAAVEALRCKRFDVAIMDLNMPVLNGVDAFRQYKDWLGNRVPTPVIALTADATATTNARCADVGFQACATKPIEPQRLLDLITQVITQSSIEVASPNLVPQLDQGYPDHPEPVRKAKVRRETLLKLEQLGGRPFVEELVKQFTSDGDNMLHCLKSAFLDRDASKFDDQLHAMRSSAGNIGADALYSVCLSLRQISPEELDAKGEEYLRQLTAELDVVRKELAGYLAEPLTSKDLVTGPIQESDSKLISVERPTRTGLQGDRL
jgi:two-component system sensor histidine kinase RpfC